MQWNAAAHSGEAIGWRSRSSAGSSAAEFPGGPQGTEGSVSLGHFAKLTFVFFIPLKKKSIGGFACSSQHGILCYVAFTFFASFTSNTLILVTVRIINIDSWKTACFQMHTDLIYFVNTSPNFFLPWLKNVPTPLPVFPGCGPVCDCAHTLAYISELPKRNGLLLK